MSRAGSYLGLSGFAGLSVGLLIGLYQTVLVDPMLFGGEHTVPRWLIGVHVHYIGLSLIVLFYSSYIDELFESYKSLVAVGAILGQWVVPTLLLLVTVTGFGAFGIGILVSAVLKIVVVLSFVVNYVRHGFGVSRLTFDRFKLQHT